MKKRDKFVAVDPDLRPSSAGVKSRPGRRSRLARGSLAASATETKRLTPVQQRVVGYTYAAMLFMLIYAAAIGMALFQPGYRPIDRVASVMMIFGLNFILIHGFGYANSMVKASWAYRDAQKSLFSPSTVPSVACIIACYNEPTDVLDETVGSVVAMDYFNKQVVILDDSTREEARQAARDVASKYGVNCIQRTSRRGYKAGAINDYLPTCKSQYVAMFDADALPAANFLRDVVPLIDENPKLAFVQTPQYYANTDVSNAAMASARQQNVFYEFICEGKSYSRAAFCCGTNVVFRRTALESNSGFDESNVTEDFATSFQLHARGWDSLYLNRKFVYSLAPENLAAYYTQQSRWSFGTLGTSRLFIRAFLDNPRCLRVGQWWEYFLSATYYWVGWVNFFFMLLPMLYIFFGIRPLRQDVITYLAVFIPYFFFTLNMFYSGMGARGFTLGEMVLGQQIGFISFPIHMTSAVSGLLGHKRPFGVTPKGVGGRIPWKALWPQITMMVLSGVAFAWGAYRYLAGYDRNTTAIVVNSMWALYHVWMLSSLFALNQPVREGKKAFFDDANEDSGPLLYPQATHVLAAPIWAGRIATSGLLAALMFVVYAGWNLSQWETAPEIPVNVSIVDKTVGPEGQGHRSLSWTLNYLKVRKGPGFNPGGPTGSRNYDWTQDYYGFVPWLNTQLVKDVVNGGGPIAYGTDRPLPARIPPPGVVYLADTFGEFSQYDHRRGEIVRVRSRSRGLSASEIDRIGAFGRRGGLVIGEWNTLGYPTRPGHFVPQFKLERSQALLRWKLADLETRQLPALRRLRAIAAAGRDFEAVGRTRGRVEDAVGQVKDIGVKLVNLQAQMDHSAADLVQLRAAERLEQMFHVRYGGWYGRFVQDFGDERDYDRPLWESVRASLSKKAGHNVTPAGPGFVFYPDGSQDVDAAGRPRLSPFAEPVAVLGNELAGSPGADMAMIFRSGKPEVKADPLLRGMSAQVPFRFWFDVVRPEPGSRVLAYYKLKLTPSAAERLRKAGFPDEYISAQGAVVFPATVAWRDGSNAHGELRSLYMAGDASNFPLPSSLAERFPAEGGLAAPLSSRFGAFGPQYLWGYYEPLLRNALTDSTRFRYQQ